MSCAVGSEAAVLCHAIVLAGVALAWGEEN